MKNTILNITLYLRNQKIIIEGEFVVDDDIYCLSPIEVISGSSDSWRIMNVIYEFPIFAEKIKQELFDELIDL